LLYYLRPCRHEWFSEKISFTACAKSLKPWLAMALFRASCPPPCELATLFQIAPSDLVTMFAQSVSLNFSRNSIPFMQYAG